MSFHVACCAVNVSRWVPAFRWWAGGRESLAFTRLLPAVSRSQRNTFSFGGL